MAEMKIRPANPLWKRLQRQWRSRRGFEQTKTHRVDWVWVDGCRYKRIRFQTQKEAEAVTIALSALDQTACFPRLIRHEGPDVWVEYIKKDFHWGSPSDAIGLFFVTLYGHQLNRPSQTIPAASVLETLAVDLNALRDRGLIDSTTLDRVITRAHQVAGPVVIKGFDYVDAVAKNFVVCQGRAVGIDVEALLADQYLGVGLAKAEYRGLIAIEPAHLIGQFGEAFAAQYPLVRLAFLARYFCEKLAQGKPKHIRLSALMDLV